MTIDAERDLIGAILQDSTSDDSQQAIGRLRREDFADHKHRIMWSAIRTLASAGTVVEESSLSHEVARSEPFEGVLGYACQLSSSAASQVNLALFASIVEESSIRRKVISACKAAIDSASDESNKPAEVAEGLSSKLLDIGMSDHSRGLVSLRQVLAESFRQLESRVSGSAPAAVCSGYSELDDMLCGGFEPGDLVLVAGRPSMGKTAFAMNVASNAAMAGKSVAVWSLEMSATKLGDRYLASEGRVSASRIKRGKMSESDWPKLARAIARGSDAKIWVGDSSSTSVHAIRRDCRRMHSKHGLDVVVIDYLQLLTPDKSPSREREVSEISRGLKKMATELGVVVIALSQLNRELEKREDKRPIKSDLRESGALEQDADTIIGMHRQEVYEKTDAGTDEWKDRAEAIVIKQRNGVTGTAWMTWVGDFVRFDDVKTKNDRGVDF